ncbi:hypothetical protein MNBD_GAMMA01-858 [hydrothermal vent metagenome]|uniref:Uncharacterized protein n=1 Tax=hydrothermal vent metagenome TaxID=652676 RepID=A0A3B0VI11_9ZZZZ
MDFSLYALPRGAWERERSPRYSTTIPRSHAVRGSGYQAQNLIETMHSHAEHGNESKVSQIYISNHFNPKEAL